MGGIKRSLKRKEGSKKVFAIWGKSTPDYTAKEKTKGGFETKACFKIFSHLSNCFWGLTFLISRQKTNLLNAYRKKSNRTPMFFEK